MRICTNCGTTNPDGVKACKNCGSLIKTVNSVVVRTHYKKSNQNDASEQKANDFNPVQHLHKNNSQDHSSIPLIKPDVSQLEYKFHSPLHNHNNQPLQSIPPTPLEHIKIPNPIQALRPRPYQNPPQIERTTDPIVLSDNTITNNDLQTIPQSISSDGKSPLHPVSIPRMGEEITYESSNSKSHPIMAFSSQSLQSQQIEQEMAEVISTLKTSSISRLGSSSKPAIEEKTSIPIPTSLDDILINLSQLDLNIEASALVTMDGTIIASAISEKFDKFLISTITNTLGTISQDVIASLESGDLKFISIFATKGILFLSPIMKNVFLVLYTTSEAKIGLINLARMVVKKRIELFYAKQNLRKSPI